MDNPIFIFSAGPRSGSTLLQRLIISSGETLVWGENEGALNHLLFGFKQFNAALQSGSKGGANGAEQFNNFLAGTEKSQQWVASMNPPAEHILETFRIMFQHLYATSAQKLKYERWGVKDVRGTSFTIEMLRIIFPKAKFLFLVRHPLESLRSIKQHRYLFKDNWGHVVTKNHLMHFAKNWSLLAQTYHAENDCFHLRYEDIKTKNFDVEKLCKYLGIQHINLDLIGGEKVDWKAQNPNEELTEDDLKQIKPVLLDAMRLWNYI